MANAKVELNHEGMAELLKAPGVVADLKARMERVRAQVGDGYTVEEVDHPTRAVVRVIGGTMWEEANTGKLARALPAAGGD